MIDWVGATVPALCAAYAAMRVAPLFGAGALGSAVGAGGVMFLIAFAFMASVKPQAATYAIAVPAREVDDETLILDRVWQEVADELDELVLDRPLVETRTSELAELLLDDALGAPDPGSRVVQLFAPDQLKQRIDRHLANARAHDAVPAGDASDALSQALAELKQSLQRA